ncbi:MAG: LLM class flavin-dependent oxidoreductase [Rhizobiaceae bacterium]|nr:LLM class flavin-dependent oxidoreductase [Rhizobiaceae bacterium]
MSIEFTFVPGSDPAGAADQRSFFFDPRATAAALSSAQRSGFATVVVDDASGLLTNIDLAAQLARSAPGLDVALTHWAGVMTPPSAAAALAALDRKCGGRLSLRMLADGLAGDDDRTGLRPGHVAVWQRMDEYLTLLKRLWANERPFDHEGPHYSIRGGFVPEKGPRGARIAIRIGGTSGSALKVAGRHADIFELAPGTLPDTRILMQRVRAAAEHFGRASQIRFALPVRLGRPTGDRTTEIAVDGSSAQSALSLLAYAEAGVSEFMVSVDGDVGALTRFADHVAPLLRNSVARRADGPDAGSATRGATAAAYAGFRS